MSLYLVKERRILREYDIVIVDEVDNMLIDQQSSPSILSRQFPTKHLLDILQIVYLLQREETEVILELLQKSFEKDQAEFNTEIIEKMKHAAQVAYVLEKGVDYIVETVQVQEEKYEEDDKSVLEAVGGKIKEGINKLRKKTYTVEVQQVTIIDPNTGYKKPGNRWENYLHEMVEIKENIPIKQASISYCSVPQCYFFGKYASICGVTGTIGDRNDQELLKQQVSDTTGQTHQDFINHSGYNTNTGSKLDSVKSRMGTEPYLFHSKFKTTVDSMTQFNSTNDYYVRIGYEGWGSNGAEQYYVGLYKEANGVWKIKFYRGTDWWPQHLIAEYELSEEQIGQLTGDGLDIFLVNSGGTVFTLYVEQDGVVDRVGTIDSPRKNQQVYNVLHASKDTNASLVTNGYFYGTGYTRATIAQKIYEN